MPVFMIFKRVKIQKELFCERDTHCHQLIVTVRHRVLETTGFWPASQFLTSARKPKRQSASF
jgi:hypothetical protein